VHHWPFSQFKWHSFAGGKHASRSKLEAVRPTAISISLPSPAPSCKFLSATAKVGLPPPSRFRRAVSRRLVQPWSAAVPFAGLPPWTLVSWSLAMVFGFFMVRIGILGKNARRYSVVFASIALLLWVVSCGGGNGSQHSPTTGTPPGISSIIVTATSATSHSAALNVTVTQ
jgi:hypothetical protein